MANLKDILGVTVSTSGELLDWTVPQNGETISASNLPLIALVNVNSAVSEAAQLALTAQEGDIAIRSDINKSFVHNGGSAGTMADWNELLTPTDSVLSVDSLTGAVDLSGTYAPLSHSHLAGDLPSTLAYKDAQNIFTDTNTFQDNIIVHNTNGVASTIDLRGNATNTAAYVDFLTETGTRAGYLGYVNDQLEASGAWTYTGGINVTGGTLQVSGNNVLTGNESISLTGDISGTGTTSIATTLAANAVGANELDVTGNGTATQFLRSNADGTFTWATPTNTTYVSSDFVHDDLTGFVANEHIDWTVSQLSNIHPNNYTNTTYASSDFVHDDLTGFVANEHIDWTTDQGATNIHPNNYINTTYSVGDGGLTQVNFTTAKDAKLTGIEALADVTDSANVNAAGAIMESDVSATPSGVIINDNTMSTATASTLATAASIKAYVDGQIASSVTYEGGFNALTGVPDLNSITSGQGDMYTVTTAGTYSFTTGSATLEVGDVLIAESAGVLNNVADWTVVNKDLNAASIKTSYESNANTNAFTDASKNKLDNITVTQAVNLDTIESWGDHSTAGYLTSFSETDTLATVAARGADANTSLRINILDGGGSPADSATFSIRGYEGRGAGIYIQDSVNSATGASPREWFVGSGYNQSTFGIGYTSTSVQTSYAANMLLNLDTSGNLSVTGTISASNLSGTNTGDQDLSGYLLNTTDTLTGTLTVSGSIAVTGTVDGVDVAGLQSRSIVAGNGLTGGGTLAASRTLNVGAGTGITVAADTVSVGATHIPDTATLLAGSVDLNTLAQADDVGFYYQSSNANATSGSNYPVDAAGSLLVQKNANTGGYGTTQLYIQYNNGQIFARGNYSVAGTWTKYFHDGYHPNADNWTTARSHTVTLTGDVTGTNTQTVNGSTNWTNTISCTVANDSHSHSNYITSNADDTKTGNLVFSASDRSDGVYGTYDPAKTQSIWSMGAAYRNSSTGANFGNLYGAAYMHDNNPNLSSYAGGHQFVWCQNGVAKAALGNNIWTSGTCTAASYNTSSDLRLKENVDLYVTKDATTIKAKTYNFIEDEDKKHHVGYIAQEVEQIIPEAVSENDEGMKSVNYTMVHTAKIAELEKKSADQTAQLEAQSAEIAELKQLVATLMANK